MPVYNVGNKVERALLSALNQTFESIEYLIIDDKGTDYSMNIVNNVINNHPRGKDIRIIDHIVNRGTGATKNSAIDNAQGEYIYFMDSDDVISHDCINLLYSKAKRYKVEIVASSHVICDEEFNIQNTCRYPYYLSGKHEDLNDFVFKKRGFWTDYTWNKLYKLSFLKTNNIRCIPYHLCEDLYFTYQVKLKCKSFHICPNITYAYVNNTNSLMGRGFNEKLVSQFYEVLLLEEDYIKNKSFNNYGYIVNAISMLYIQLLFEIKRSKVIDNDTREIKRNSIINSFKDYVIANYSDKILLDLINKYTMSNSIDDLMEWSQKTSLYRKSPYFIWKRILNKIWRMFDEFTNLHNNKFITN